jgi:hypothetical protein
MIALRVCRHGLVALALASAAGCALLDANAAGYASTVRGFAPIRASHNTTKNSPK